MIVDVSSIILNVHLMIFHALYPCLHYNAENAERTKRNTKHVSARQEKMYVHYVRSFKQLPIQFQMTMGRVNDIKYVLEVMQPRCILLAATKLPVP